MVKSDIPDRYIVFENFKLSFKKKNKFRKLVLKFIAFLFIYLQFLLGEKLGKRMLYVRGEKDQSK